MINIVLWLVLLLFTFWGLSCHRPEPPEGFDWYQALVKREISYGELEEPACYDKEWQVGMIIYPNYFAFKYDTANLCPIYMSVQDSPTAWVAYCRWDWREGEKEFGLYSDLLHAYVYNLKTRELVDLGLINYGRNLDLGGNKVIYSYMDQGILFDLETRGFTPIGIATIYNDISPKGAKVFFRAAATNGPFERSKAYICRTNDLGVLHEFEPADMGQANWLNDSVMLFVIGQSSVMQYFNVRTGETGEYGRTTANHFMDFMAVSPEGRFVYGNNAYWIDLARGTISSFDDLHPPCHDRSYVFDCVLPNGQLVVPRQYYLLDSVARTCTYQAYIHMFNPDGTQERRVELRLP
ncbi:MAG: hypothetical protein HYZ16_11975 [Bacteroidetes bacterium]|jgi:hypothetical protein|nr:hypothetical protein [Bacteroidota bacterium]